MTTAPIPDRWFEGHVQRRADQARVDDRIDLQGDPIADPTNDNAEFQFEFARVTEIERETPTCIVLYTTQGAFGFPPDHWLDVDGEQVRDA